MAASRKPRRKPDIDTHGVRELTLYVDNDRRSHDQKNAIYAALARKVCQNKYDQSKAPKAFMTLVRTTARAYDKDFSGSGSAFNSATKAAAADQLAKDFASELRDCQTGKFCDLPSEARSRLAKCSLISMSLAGARKRKRK